VIFLVAYAYARMQGPAPEEAEDDEATKLFTEKEAGK
jgi:hypothetical protein